jgi:hypothetical protein
MVAMEVGRRVVTRRPAHATTRAALSSDGFSSENSTTCRRTALLSPPPHMRTSCPDLRSTPPLFADVDAFCRRGDDDALEWVG